MNLQQRKKEFDEYYRKQKQLQGLVETEARNLASLQEQVDSVIHNKKTAEIENKKIDEEIKVLKVELEELDIIIKRKTEEHQNQNKGYNLQVDKVNKGIATQEFKKKELILEIDKLDKQSKKLIPTAKECEKKEKELIKLDSKIEKSSIELNGIIKKSDKIIEMIKNKQWEVKVKNDKCENWFRSLQKYETGLDFYANRLRKWYQDKGLSLPIQYISENIKLK